MEQFLAQAPLIISVVVFCACALFAFLFWNVSLTNRDRFTKTFLKMLSICSILRAYEIASAGYRIYRIPAACVPVDAAIAGLQGRCVELIGYLILIWFLLRPETNKALNGNTVQSGTLMTFFLT